MPSYVIIIRLVTNSRILCFMMKRWCDKVSCIYVALNREIKILIPKPLSHLYFWNYGARIKSERSRKLNFFSESQVDGVLFKLHFPRERFSRIFNSNVIVNFKIFNIESRKIIWQNVSHITPYILQSHWEENRIQICRRILIKTGYLVRYEYLVINFLISMNIVICRIINPTKPIYRRLSTIASVSSHH